MTVSTASSRQLIWAAVADVVSVVVFVAIGRRSHDESGNVVTGALKVAAPFVIGLAAGWLVARAWRRPLGVDTALVIWPTTIVVGMLLRRFVFDRGTATAFIVVASCFTGLFLVGWRALTGWWAGRRTTPSSTSA